MYFFLNPDVFALGVAVGVLGLVLLLSLLVAFAYDESTLFYLAGYLALMVALVLAGSRLSIGQELIQRLVLVIGPALISGLQFWLLRNRKISRLGFAAMAAPVAVTVGLLCFYAAGGDAGIASALCVLWIVVLVASSLYLCAQAWDTAGPWKWWFLLGQGLGLLVAASFLTDLADAKRAYWPVLFMLLVQAPPIYLSLVWRSRLLNEIRLRSAAASTIDPLTGLATTPVLVERLMRIMSRAQQARLAPSGSALFLIEVKNWNGLLLELGPEFNEKLLLEAALRLRRSIGDNDLVARIHGGRFAVLAQGLANPQDITTLATRLVVSGLRIDSPLLPGVEFKFHVIVTSLKLSKPLALPAMQAWLDNLAKRFTAWPKSYRSRSILVVDSDADDFRDSNDSEVDSSY
jgi:GGDEF domain-containing protein